MTYLYLSSREWHSQPEMGSGWRAPGGNATGILDLIDPVGAGSVEGQQSGVSILTYDSPQAGMNVSLGTDLEANLSLAQVNGIEQALALPSGTIQQTQVIRLLRELFLDHYDATGATKWKPLRVNRRRRSEIYLANLQLYEEFVTPTHPAWQAEIDGYQDDYRHIRATAPLELAQRFTGAKMRTLRLTNPKDILPPEYENDGFRIPATTIGDTFVEASNTDLTSHTATGPNGGHSWVEDEGDAEVAASSDDLDRTTGNVHALANSALSDDSHYSEADVVAVSSPGWCGVAARYRNTGTFHAYTGWHRPVSSNTYRRDKWLEGTRTDGLSAAETPPTLPITIRLDCDGSTMKVLIDSIEKISGTDTSITGINYCGLYGDQNRAMTWDNFEADDGGAAAAKRRRVGFGAGHAIRR